VPPRFKSLREVKLDDFKVGKPLDLILGNASVRPPRMRWFRTAGRLTWDLTRGTQVVLLGRRSMGAGRGGRPVGARLQREDLWELRARLESGIRLHAPYLHPHSIDALELPIERDTPHGEVVEFQPESVTITQVERTPWDHMVSHGLFNAGNDLPWNLESSASTKTLFAEQGHSSLDQIQIELGDDIRCQMKRAGKFLTEYRLLGGNPARHRRARNHVLLGVEIATGTRVRSLQLLESLKKTHTLELRRPGADPGFSFPPLPWHVRDGQFAQMVRNLDKACEASRRLYCLLKQSSSIYPTESTLLEEARLAASTRLEGLAGNLLPFLNIKLGRTSRVSPTKIEGVRNALGAGGVNPVLISRILGAIWNWGSRTGQIALQALADQQKGGFTPEDFQEWKRVRNPAAHGREKKFDETVFKSVARMYGMVSKLIFRAIEYYGPFVDYSDENWSVRAPGGP
jgi:hypothetical protein